MNLGGRRALLTALAIACVAALGACGNSGGAAVDLPRASVDYDGPLYVEKGRYGAAGQVLGCRLRPAAGRFERAEVYAEGATGEDVAEAMDTARSEGLFLDLPNLDLAIARTERDRVLLTYATGGAVKAALVFHDGPATEGAGGAGWYLESWARCDRGVPRGAGGELLRLPALDGRGRPSRTHNGDRLVSRA